MVTTTNIRGKGTVNFCIPLNHDFVIDCMDKVVVGYTTIPIHADICNGVFRWQAYEGSVILEEMESQLV